MIDGALNWGSFLKIAGRHFHDVAHMEAWTISP
jgi:hypothetical protein